MMQNFEDLAMLAILWGVFTAIFWMVVGWRAMRAHERLADSVESLARQRTSQRETQSSSSTGD